ncbi:MAG: gamma-glutamyl-phosphate reductase, partial [Clostridia bacterium]|nr:gamma-glutamyl-phosphate reductase [Clostridia bacterium]
MTELEKMGARAKKAARVLASAGAKKSAALLLAAERLSKRKDEVLAANEKDMNAAVQNGMSPALQDRLRLTAARVEDMCEGIRATAAQPDPVGRVLEGSV